MKKTIIITICLLCLAGCSVHFYARVGPQKVKKVTVIIEDQESDPNAAEIAKALVGAALLVP